MAWMYLAFAAIFEVIFALSMKASQGFTVFWPTLLTISGVAGGIFFLTLALKTLPVGVGYPIWVGVGVLGTVIFGALFFNESLGWIKIISVVAIMGGVIGLKLSLSH